MEGEKGKKRVKKDNFLANGKSLNEFNIKNLIKIHLQHQNGIHICMCKNEDPNPFFKI